MALYCPVTGVRILSDPDWINQKVSNTFAANFWIINGSVIYSLPKGNADLEGVQNSLALNDIVAKRVSGGDGPYIQIEDYHFLTGSSLAARKYFISQFNKNKRVSRLFFCNLSMPFSIAVNIGQRFITSGINIHVVKNYKDAIKQALAFYSQTQLESYLAPINIRHYFTNKKPCLTPVELIAEDSWNVQTPEYSNRSVLIEQSIMHSTPVGYLESQHIELNNRTRSLCRSAIAEDAAIQYIIVDCGRLKGGSRQARKQYMQSLKSWHQQFPLRMYIAYSANTFMKTALHLAKPLMPFKVKIAKDIHHAFDLIHKDRVGSSSEPESVPYNAKPTMVSQKDISKLMAYISGINWEQKGIDDYADVNESHPFYFLYQSIKLIKEELDALFSERKQSEEQIAASLKEKEVLLREIHHRVKNNMQSIISMLNLHSRRTSDKHVRKIFNECQDRISAMSLIHETLYRSNDLARIDFENYINKLCQSLSRAHGAPEKGITVSVERCTVTPNIDQSIAVGMVICELVANAFQHAFPSGNGGQVAISITGQKKDQVELIVSDNGIGLPPEVDIFNPPSLGLQLALATVTRQLNGTIRAERNGGTQFIICFECKSS